jgi:ribosomal protein S18 acetylase RimI-like enzyme
LADPTQGRAHLNLVESSRLLFELDPGARVETGDGWLFGAGSPDHPTISNAAFRTDDGFDPEEFLVRARGFFGALGRGFTAWARSGMPEDRDLFAAAEEDGVQSVYEMPEMILGDRVEQLPLAEGVELRRLDSAEDAADYWRIASAAYQSIGFPPEVFDFYEGLERLAAPGSQAAAFLAFLDGAPAGIAMTIVSHGVAGIYWVGSLDEARGRGIGRAVTAAATNAGFELGADVASLQASPMGGPIYRAMGYETIYDYRLLHSPAPDS